MRKRFFAILILLLLGKVVVASHIVGGGFELLHSRGYQYQLNMILFFDVNNGEQGAKDENIFVGIFDKRTNTLIAVVSMFLSEEVPIDYTQPNCSTGEVISNKLSYSKYIILSPTIYNDPMGYYISWERCCRNYEITNVFSFNPQENPDLVYAGQTFYLEFPPVVKDNIPFVDSTPRLITPLSDYGCPLRPFYLDFKAIDDDGDSLTYSLINPLSTLTADPLPLDGIPRSGPYMEVVWQEGYGLNNIMNGNPKLKVSKEGLLTVTPTIPGLFSFSVKIEEFRNKIKIGEVRRDFQLFVARGCAPSQPPIISGKKLTSSTFSNSEIKPISLLFPNSTLDNERCIVVRISDPDSESSDSEFVENIFINTVGLNFSSSELQNSMPPVTTAKLENGSTADFIICFPECPLVDGVAKIEIIARDDACSIPLSDTLKIDLIIEPPTNSPPYFVAPTPKGDTIEVTLEEGNSIFWPISVKDDELDDIQVIEHPINFKLDAVGMKLKKHHDKGVVNDTLFWDAYCDVYDFTKKTDFVYNITYEDQDKCNISFPISKQFILHVNLPENSKPIIQTDLTLKPQRVIEGITREIFQTLHFTVTGSDLVDNDLLTLSGTSIDFNYKDYGVQIAPANISSKSTASLDFIWTPTCDMPFDLSTKNIFGFQFIVMDDKNKCRFILSDSVDVMVEILPLPNIAPSIQITVINPVSESNQNEVHTVVGNPVDFQIRATDADTVFQQDNLKIEMEVMNDQPIDGITFESVEGVSPIDAYFHWLPDCSAFTDENYSQIVPFRFKVTDDRCFSSKEDFVDINVHIEDTENNFESFNPPNFFSPNGDGYNQYFTMEVEDPQTKNIINILPKNNCMIQFVGVSIYNRWGNELFRSNSPDFKWDGDNNSAGTYFYHINFGKKEIRGTVTIVY